MDPRDEARQVGVVDAWASHTRVFGSGNNPGNAAIPLDTGALLAGLYDITAMIGVSAALGIWNFGFQWRNAANDTTLYEQVILTAGADLKIIQLKGIYVQTIERFRWYVLNAWVGWYSVSILATRRG